MALSYCSVRLGVLPPDAEDWIVFFHSLTDFKEFETGWYSATGIDHLPLPPEPVPEPPRPGVLVWPTGLSRCGYFHGVVDSVGLAEIRTALGADSAGPGNLVLTDGTGNSRTFSLYLLPPRPLFQIDGRTQLYHLTLVDQRYFLRTRTGSVTAAPATWADLLGDLATDLGITLTPAAVSASYGTPTDRWVFYEKPLAVLLDAVCNEIGHRLVANTDGTFKTVTATEAKTDSDTQYALLSKTAGGQLVEGDLRRPVPAAVETHFREQTGGLTLEEPFTVSVTLASLALTGFDSAAGVTGSTYPVFGNLIYTGSNGASCTTYATQAATDYYLWQLCDLDVTLPGITEWEPTGAEDRVEWLYQSGGRLLTRILRGPWQTLPAGGSSSCCGEWESQYGPYPNAIFRTLPLNGDPSTQFFVYTGPVIDATADSPLFFTQVADTGPDGGPYFYQEWRPEGTNGDIFFYQELSSDGSGDPAEWDYFVQMTPDQFFQMQLTPDLWTYFVQMGDGTDETTFFVQQTPLIYQEEWTATDGTDEMGYIVQLTPQMFQQEFTDGTNTATMTVEPDGVGGFILEGANIVLAGSLAGGGSARTEGTLAAAGSVQGDAAAITTDAVRVTGADSTKGVILPNTAAGLVVVWNDASIPDALKVYPPSGALFAASSTNTPLTQNAGEIILYVRVTSTVWTTQALVGFP